MKKSYRSLLCIVFSLLILIPATPVNAKENQPLNVFVVSDCHYRPLSMLGPIGEQTGLPGDPLYWYANDTGELTYESDAIMNEFLKGFEASSAKILLVPGDLTNDGYLPEHFGLAAKFKDFENRTGKKIFVINGNHDIRGSVADNSINLAEFKSIYSDFGYSEALAVDENSASYTADLEGKYRLLAIDAVVIGTDKSIINADLLNWIEVQVKKAKEDGKELIGMVHYSILEHFKNQNLAVKYLTVDNYRGISSKLADWGIKYVFTGHVHGNDISGAVSEKANSIFDVETCSLISYPNSYRSVTFSDTEVKIESKNIDKINISDLPPGYFEEQLDLIQNDFQGYSYGYFKASMNCFINKYIGSPEMIAKALKINRGTAAYNALDAVMTNMGTALNLPIYDKKGTPEIDSVQEIAMSVGEAIDASEYKNLADIIGTVIAANFSGVEDIPYDSPAVRLFGQCFKSALVYALVNIPAAAANVIFKEFDLPMNSYAINNNTYTNAAKLVYMKTAASKIINEIIKPILQGFTSDSYAPGDLNVTLEPYGAPAGAESPAVIISDARFILDVLIRLAGIVLNSVKDIVTL